MLKLMFVGSIALATFSACEASAQGICPLNGTPNHNLVCVLPQLYGPSGLGSGPNAPLLANGHQAHFEGDFLSSFGPINEAVGIQVSHVAIVKRLTAAFDFYGQRLFGVPQLFSSPYTDLGKCGDASCSDLTPGTMPIRTWVSAQPTTTSLAGRSESSTGRLATWCSQEMCC